MAYSGRVRYRPNHREFGQMIMSDQIQDAVDAAMRDGLAMARELAPESKDPRRGIRKPAYAEAFDTEPAVVVLNGSPRRAGRILNTSPQAAGVEFGSGITNAGTTGPNERPQRGFSKPQRVLGRTGARLGEYKQ